MKTTKKRVGITNRKRFTLFFIMMLLIVCCGFSSVSSYVSGNDGLPIISVFVAPGDTLWDIAISNNPNHKDVRKLIYEIKQVNHLSTTTIHVGDEIIIPV